MLPDKDICKEVLLLSQEAALRWFESPTFIEFVRYAALILAAGSGMIAAATETKKDGRPNRWGKTLIAAGLIALAVGGVNEWNDFHSKDSEARRIHTFQQCELVHLEGLTATLGEVTGNLQTIVKSAADTSTHLATNDELLSSEVKASSNILHETRRTTTPLFPMTMEFRLLLHAPDTIASIPKYVGQSPFDQLLLFAMQKVPLGGFAPYEPYSKEKVHIIPIGEGFPSKKNPWLADPICAPRYQIYFQRRPIAVEKLVALRSNADLILSNEPREAFAHPRQPPETCADFSRPGPHFVNELVFLKELREMAVRQRFNITAPDQVIVDNHEFRSCLDLEGATLYIPFIMNEAQTLDLREIDLTTCGDVGRSRKIVFSPADRQILDTSEVVYSKKLTSKDLGIN